jgi:hypothetical protein
MGAAPPSQEGNAVEAFGRSWRIRVGLGGVAAVALAIAIWGVRPVSAPPRASLGPPGRQVAAAAPPVDLERLYTLDHLVLEGDPVLDLRAPARVSAGPPRRAVAEPHAATLWIQILCVAALYTLYLPARSW